MYEQAAALDSGSGVRNLANAAKTVSPAVQRLNALRESQNETHDTIARLEIALSEVLGPEIPEPANGSLAGAKSDAPSTSQLCEELDRRISMEHNARWRINRLIERLTV